MLWFDSFTGEVKLHGPTPSAPSARRVQWTAFDIPLTAFTTGDVKNDLKAVADAGWLMMNNGSIVDASSGGRARSNTHCQACSC